MPELSLYYMPTCPFCRKVLQFMEEKSISIPLNDILEGAENRQKLIDIGGKPRVPCLVMDGKALYESGDIIAWLDKNWGK